MASIYKRGEDGPKKKAHWYIAFTDHTGQRRTRKGFTDKALTEQLAAKLEQEVMLRKRGLIDPAAEEVADQKKLAIGIHLEAYEKSLKGRKTTGKHVGLTLSRVRKVIDGCGIETLADIREDSVEEFLGDMLEQENIGHRTYNHYVQAIDGFSRWLVSTKRLTQNPVTGLVRLNNAVDVRHKRRALSEDEFARLVQSAREGGEIQCFTGEERARIYIVSYLTGLRRKEIASLTPRSFDLQADPPTLTVQAACSKHRKLDTLPIHPQLAKLVAEWSKGLPPDEVFFPKLARRRTWLMVKKDLERVGIPYETPEGIADFHAAGRHTYITGLLRNGASLPEAKELARHSDVNMTMRYAHIGIQDRAKALASLPFQERVRSASDGVGRHSVSPAGTDRHSEGSDPEKTNPGGSRGYVILCRNLPPCGTSCEKWRRRELNPRPERPRTWRLHAYSVDWSRGVRLGRQGLSAASPPRVSRRA